MDSTGRFGFHNRDHERSMYAKSLPEISRRATKKRKALSKNKIYLRTPDSSENLIYQYDADDPRDVTSSFHRGHTNVGSQMEGRKIVHTKTKSIFPAINAHKHNTGANKRKYRKGMIIGERPSIWKSTEPRRPELPGNLFVDNLRERDVDWRQYDNVTWNDVLDSYQRDLSPHVDYAQTLPQKEAWLASIDSRVRYSKMSSHRTLPSISPRLFGDRISPPKPPVHARYLTKDKQGNITYLVGPTDNSQYTPFTFPEIVQPEVDYKKIDF